MAASHASSAIDAIVTTYRKAPVTLSLFASYFVSQLVSKLWLDYRLFVALPGGPLPKNIFGWAVHYFALSPLSLHRSWTSGKLTRAFLPKLGASDPDKLSTGVTLSKRPGSAPLTAGTIPHRQLDQFSSEVQADLTEQEHASEPEESLKQAQEAISHLLAALQKEAEAQPSHVRLGPSIIESHSTALFAVSHTLVTGSDNVSRSTRSAQFPSALSRRFLSSLRGEFVHVHCSTASEGGVSSEDGSLHMTLSPDDAALVVEQGWGELHPLAGFPSYSGFWFGWPAWMTQLRPSRTRSARWWTSSSVPTAKDGKVSKALGLSPTYCLVYSPRNMEEAKVVQDIIGAATLFAIGTRSPR
ncbi:uncharacterized protein UTRI_02859 [Ustilago trichophora]|uniref:Luciferase domain-containing protein n=1 Tax=Ustilago trichophora TaxID=86804 RepID=A0A5C3EPD2_9BASI|nr:uncharacterized protein UTRI_02859 [Ustilago trichophora]